MITLLFFASLKERLGCAREAIEVPTEVNSVGRLREWLRARGGAWEEALAPAAQVKVAVNQAMAAMDTPISDGDEVAFFPPVTGG